MSSTYDPESIRDGACTLLTDSGIEVFGAKPEDIYYAKVVRNPDGSQSRVPTSAGATYPAPLRSSTWTDSGSGVLCLPPRDAAMVGLFHMVRSITWQSFNLAEVVDGRARVGIMQHHLIAIAFDWPDWGQEESPVGRALITSIDQADYEQPGDVRLLEHTYGVFEPGTVLRYLGEQTIPLTLVCWCAHKDQRRGLEAKLLELLAAEPDRDLPGRRVMIPEYFNRIARYTLRGSMRPDDAERAGSHEYVLEVPVTAEIEHVVLVESPGFLRNPVVDVEAE